MAYGSYHPGLICARNIPGQHPWKGHEPFIRRRFYGGFRSMGFQLTERSSRIHSSNSSVGGFPLLLLVLPSTTQDISWGSISGFAASSLVKMRLSSTSFHTTFPLCSHPKGQKERDRDPETTADSILNGPNRELSRSYFFFCCCCFFFGDSNVLFRMKIYSKNTHIMMWDLSPRSSSSSQDST